MITIYDALTKCRYYTTEVRYLTEPLGYDSDEAVVEAAKADGRIQVSPDSKMVRIAPEHQPGSATKKPAKEKKKPTTKVGKVVDVPTTSDGSNKHLWAILNDRNLDCYEQAMAHRLHAYYFSSKKPVEIASATLGKECGMSSRKAKDVSASLVAKGYFRRLDNGLGGKGGSNKPKFVATLPDWKL